METKGKAMMTCGEIKDVILTDYIDGALEEKVQLAIERHLDSCSACRSFAEEVRQTLVQPFQSSPREPVPAHVWSRITEEIEEEHCPAKAPAIDWVASWRQWLLGAPGMALAGVIVCVVLVNAVFGIVQNRQVQLAKDRDQVDYLASILDHDQDLFLETENGSLATPIENYFL